MAGHCDVGAVLAASGGLVASVALFVVMSIFMSCSSTSVSGIGWPRSGSSLVGCSLCTGLMMVMMPMADLLKPPVGALKPLSPRSRRCIRLPSFLHSEHLHASLHATPAW